jgi:methylthioribose-1-phosphate isomerase
LEQSTTPQPIRAVARGLGPAIVAAAILALAVARSEVARDEQQFRRLQTAAEAAGTPGVLEARPTAATLFWRAGNPDRPREDRSVRRETDEADAPF